MNFIWIILVAGVAASKINVTTRVIETSTNNKIYFYDRINDFEFNATDATNPYVRIEFTNGMLETSDYACDGGTCNYIGSYVENEVLNSLRQINYTAGVESGVITFKLKDRFNQLSVSVVVVINNPASSDCSELTITTSLLIFIMTIGWLLTGG